MIPCPRCRARVSPKALRAHLLFHVEEFFAAQLFQGFSQQIAQTANVVSQGRIFF